MDIMDFCNKSTNNNFEMNLNQIYLKIVRSLALIIIKKKKIYTNLCYNCYIIERTSHPIKQSILINKLEIKLIFFVLIFR